MVHAWNGEVSGDRVSLGAALEDQSPLGGGEHDGIAAARQGGAAGGIAGARDGPLVSGIYHGGLDASAGSQREDDGDKTTKGAHGGWFSSLSVRGRRDLRFLENFG